MRNKRKSIARQSAIAVPGTARSGETLSPEFKARQWKPGQSGNPNGNRGSAYGEVVRIARRFSETAIMRLVELMQSEDERVAFMASQAILDRAIGKPKEQVVEESQNSGLEERRKATVALFVRLMECKSRSVHTRQEGSGSAKDETDVSHGSRGA